MNTKRERWILLELELYDELAYHYILAPLLDNFTRSLKRQEYSIKHIEKKLSSEQRHLKFLGLEIEKITFLKKTIANNIDLIEEAASSTESVCH